MAFLRRVGGKTSEEASLLGMSQSRFRLRTLLLSVTVLAIALTAYRHWPLHGPLDYVLSLGLAEDTVYADGYSDSRFKSVRYGMTRGEVHRRLCPPLGRNVFREEGRDIIREWWSYSPGDTHHRARYIWYRDDKVTKREAYSYID